MTRASLLGVAAAVLGTSATSCATTKDTLAAGPSDQTVRFGTKETGTVCEAGDLRPKDKVRVSASNKDTVTWDFKNNCSKEMTLEVGNFRPAPGFNNKDSAGNALPFDVNPLDPTCTKKVAVSGKRSAKLKCGFKIKFKPRDGVSHKFPEDARSYKYDILGNGKVLLDPEVEVRP
jgi:hypothetical protein